MRIDELQLVCQEAAQQIVARGERPLPATVVLPLPSITRVIGLPDFPDEDQGRERLLERLADDELRPANAPAYGFVAEGLAAAEDGTGVIEVVVVVYGARGHHPWVTAAELGPDGVGPFAEPEPLAPAAMPFLAPLQRAVDSARPPDVMFGQG